jgi:hypothetical protein
LVLVQKREGMHQPSFPLKDALIATTIVWLEWL